MAQEQNYQVNYSINVDASQGTKQVIAFGEAVGKLVQAKASLTPAVTNIKNMMDEIDRVFRTKNGKKRNFDYRLTIDTKKSEEKLERIKGLLTDISTLSKGISLTINAGQALDSKKIKANAKSLYEKKAAEMRKAEIEKNAASSVGTMADAQKRITKAIGKINSALVSMERDRELQIKTGTAENRLQQILSLLGRIKSASVISFNMQGGIPSEGLTPSVPVPYAPQAFVISSCIARNWSTRRSSLPQTSAVRRLWQKPPRRKSGVPMKRGLKNGSARMPPVLRRKYAGRQNRHAVRQKRNV